MSTTNYQHKINSRHQTTCADEEQQHHGRTKADQQQQQQQIQWSRRRGGAATAASRSPVDNSSQGRRCARCGGALGRFYNTGASCPRCRHRVCRQCREFRGSATANNKGDQGAEWLCAVCHKIAELHAATGEWIYEAASVTSRRVVAVKKNSPVDILKRSIRRAWTINGPPARWSLARKSPEFRIYRSLPLREKIYPHVEEVDTEQESFTLRQISEILATNDDDNSFVSHTEIVKKNIGGEKCKGNDVADDDCREHVVACNRVSVSNVKNNKSENLTGNTKAIEKKQQCEDVTSFDSLKTRKNESTIVGTTIDRTKADHADVSSGPGTPEQIPSRISLIKPPRILAKLGTPETKQSPKHGDRKSNIPIFRRSSREFEDIGSPQETAKRSLIPQRYRGSTDDLRRSREDISVPSLIPKLFSPRSKEQDKLKRQDSKDDVRQISKGNRRESKDIPKEETRAGSFTNVREELKSGIRIFRRDSREDVGRESVSPSGLSVQRTKQTCKDEKQERTTEAARVGDSISKSKFWAIEQGKTGSKAVTKEDRDVIETKIIECESGIVENTVINRASYWRPGLDTVEPDNMANKNTEDTEKVAEKDTEDKEDEEEIDAASIPSAENIVTTIETITKNKEIFVETTNCSETNFAGAIVGERKALLPLDSGYPKRVDDMQVVRRKFSKEEFSNPDDTDETPNRRSSSHLSPEASPLSTRSSRYSPRESESEPTPALPRKIGSGDFCTASQRIRDTISRTRRESNSSARYESSGSESVRLSESGLHGYADLARRVKFFGGGGNSPGPSPGSDELVQRDSATSAGEDEPQEDCHSRGPGSSQGRTMLRRRRQFDAQGSRRRGRSHARTCCGEELQNLQALHVISRGGGRQSSPPQGHTHETPNPDYRRLVFISSDSSSGREEDDADSSCSGSSYLNGLPRNSNAHGLEDCDWDYFESGTLPLPAGVPDATIDINQVGVNSGISRDWSCCPGRGSTACLACGGSPGTNVLPVPVPIPVPVPYPVPVPASLWTGDFAAAASSMITRGTTPEGTLRLRGDPSAPWFSWHPRFNQPLHGARIDPRSAAGAFDPSAFAFRSEEITPRLYGPAVEQQGVYASSSVVPPTESASPAANSTAQIDDSKDATSPSTKSVASEEPEKPEPLSETPIETVADIPLIADSKIVQEVQDTTVNEAEKHAQPVVDDNTSEPEGSNEDTEDSSQESSSDRENVEQRMYHHSREDSGSSSGRSSADSSDLDDSASHHFSRVFVVNDDSLTSDNDIEDNEDSDSAREGVVTLKRATSLPEEEPVVLRRVRLLDEDMNLQRVPGEAEIPGERAGERRPNRIERRIDLLVERDPDANEIYLAGSTDCSDSHIELKSIKNLNPDSIEMSIGYRNVIENYRGEGKALDVHDISGNKSWDSVVTPDSLEVVDTSNYNNLSRDTDASIQENSTYFDKEQTCLKTGDIEIESEPPAPIIDSNNAAIREDKPEVLSVSVHESSVNVMECTEVNDTVLESNASKSNILVNSSSCSTTDSSETNTTGSEVSSDELHEYEVSPYAGNDSSVNAISVGSVLTESTPPRVENKNFPNRTSNGHQVTPVPRRTLRLLPAESSPSNFESANDSLTHVFVSTPKKDHILPVVAPNILKTMEELQKCENMDTPEEKKKSCLKNTKNSTSSDPGAPTPAHNVGDIISSKIHEIFKNVERVDEVEEDTRCSGETAASRTRDDSDAVRGEKPDGRQVGGSEVCGGGGSGGNDGEAAERGTATARFRSVERRPPTRKENGCFPPTALAKDQARASPNFPSNNKYRSLVMITQGAYQPVSVITSDTTTLLQPPEETQPPQGLAGYFHLALEAVSEPHQRNGQGPKRPLMVKRLAASSTEQEVDSGLSVGSASESDDVQSIKSSCKHVVQQQAGDQNSVPKLSADRQSIASNNDEQNQQQQQSSRPRIANQSPQSSDDNSGRSGVVILEEGLADDDSWVEEVSHDEDEQSATTATEESSEDEANNLGDREEELRGYHRQAIDFTLHTIVEESCEESEAEPSLATGSPRKKQRPPSASELEKYFFFGLGGENSSVSMGSREVDSLSETSSIYSEGLESLGQEEASPTSGQENKGSNEFLNSSRLEKYFLSEFLGFDQDRRDSDGSVGSDSEGRPSPEAQRRKRLVRARGTGRSSHSSSLDNLLALAQGSQNLSSQNSLQDLSLNQDSQETQSEGSSTETDGAEDGQTPAFGTDGQFDTVKRKKKKPRTLGTQSPRVPEDRNKTPEPRDIMVSEVAENEGETINSEDDRAKTPQPESALHSSSSSSSQMDAARGSQNSSSDTSSSRSKQQSRDSGFVGSCDDLLQHQKPSGDNQSHDGNSDIPKDHSRGERSRGVHGPDTDKKRGGKSEILQGQSNLHPPPNASLSRKDSFNNWSSDEETNLMMSKMRQFFKTMVANSNGQTPAAGNSSGPSPAPSPRLSGYSKARLCSQHRTKPPQLVYFENELTRLMKTVPGIRDEQVREIVEYLSSEDTWSDSYDSSDYTSSDLEGAAGGRRSALQEQISQSCQQIISKFDTNSSEVLTQEKESEEKPPTTPQPCLGRDTAFVYQKLVQSFTKIAGDGPSSDANSTPHSSPPLIAKVMHHIGSRLVALMHEVSEGGSTVQPHSTWRRYSQHHRTPSSASTTEDDDSTSDSTNAPPSSHLPRSKSHDPLLLINGHPATTGGQEGEEREASDYERFSWRGSFESALMAADSRTKLSLLACSGDVSASASASALAMAAKRRSAGDLLFNPKSFSREQLDRVRSCGSIGGGTGSGVTGCGGSIEEKIWSNRRRSSVPDANTRGESGASAGDDDTEDELEYGSDPRATTLPRGMQAAAAAASAATNSLPRLPASTGPGGSTAVTSTTPMHKAHSVYHFLPQHTGVKSARYRPPGFARNSLGNAGGTGGPKRAVSAPGLQVTGTQVSTGKRETSRSRRQQAISLTPDDGSSLSEACSTPIIGAGSRAGSSHTVLDIDDMDRGLHSGHLATRASLSSLGARSDSMASVYSGAGEGRWCGSVAVRGEVEFSLQYDYKQLTFEVHVTQCKDLAPVDIKRNRSDPYVKVYLLPDKSKSGKRKTKVKKHTLNPVFDETLKFHMSLNGLETRTLWLTVWHSDMFGRNDFLGEVRMPLENKIFDDPTPRWYPLQERTEPFDDPIAYKGEVIVGLKFVPPDPAQLERERETSIDHRGIGKGRKNWSRGSLHVLVKEARNLQTRAKNSGTCDPFCKSYLLPDKGRSGKQKTGVVRRSGGSPVWGHTFIYKDVSLQELAERGLELTVWDHDRIASNEFLGGVRFNLGTGKHYGKVVDWMDATGRELSLWQSMLERPNFWVEGAVTLRPNLHNHGKGNGT